MKRFLYSPGIRQLPFQSGNLQGADLLNYKQPFHFHKLLYTIYLHPLFFLENVLYISLRFYTHLPPVINFIFAMLKNYLA